MRRLFSTSFIVFLGLLTCMLCSSCGNNTENYSVTDDSRLDTLHSLFEELALSYETSDRTAWQKPREVINLMGNLEDKTVADIGAGTGYFTIRLARQAKKVIAVDIDTMALNYIDSIKWRLESETAAKIETRLAEPDNPNLEMNEVDVILMVNTYPFIPDRPNYFKSLMEHLNPEGQVLIIDFKKKRLPIGPPSSQKIALNVVEQEMEQAGFELIDSDDRLLDYQYVVLFRKSAS